MTDTAGGNLLAVDGLREVRPHFAPLGTARPPPVLVSRREQNAEQPASGPATPAIVALPAAAGTLPDLRGLSARDALHALSRIGLTTRLVGTGVVIEQDPPPGSPVERGRSCELRLQRQPRGWSTVTQP